MLEMYSASFWGNFSKKWLNKLWGTIIPTKENKFGIKFKEYIYNVFILSNFLPIYLLMTQYNPIAFGSVFINIFLLLLHSKAKKIGLNGIQGKKHLTYSCSPAPWYIILAMFNLCSCPNSIFKDTQFSCSPP